MITERQDRRTQYTLMVLRQSLLKLLQHKPLNKITVTELCDLANINRSTFYVHYTDPYDLMTKIENELYDEFMRVVKYNEEPQPVSQLLEQLLEVVKSSGDLVKVVLNQQGERTLLSRIVLEFRDRGVLEMRSFSPATDEHVLERYYTFVVSGCVGIIQAWVQTGMQESPHDFALFINKAIYGGLGAMRYDTE